MEFLEGLEVKNSNKKNGNITEGSDLNMRIVELRRKRDALKMQLQAVERMIIDKNITSEEDMEEVESEELRSIKDNYEEMCTLRDCYRLTGFSVYSVEDTKIIFSYDTSYLGKSLETFYLEMEDLQNEQFVVRRHSFPPFVPVDDLEKTLLKEQPRRFLMKLGDYLFAYIARREETKIVLNKFKEKVSVNSSEPYDYIELKIGHHVNALQLEFQIIYTDILTTHPAKCNITTIVNDDKEGHEIKPKKALVSQWRTYLQTMPLSEAVDKIMSDYTKNTVYAFNE